MAVRRSPWMDSRAQLLVRLLAEKHGMEIDEATAREDVSAQVDAVAERMRIGRQAAKYYVDDAHIEKLADHIARIVNRELARESLKPASHLRSVRPWERADRTD